MKKILTVSLGALLIVGAANAETTSTGIASVSYVDGVAANKQNTITDLATIRSGAALGATAVQNLGNLGVTATATELNYVDGVTSNIQTQLNSKQASLGYTAENAANKVTSVSSTSTDDQYPSAKAMYTALAGKQASLGYSAENAANKTQTIDASSTATQYPSAKAVKTALDYKVNIKQGTNNAGKGLLVDGTTGELALADIATQEELAAVARTASSGQTATQVNTAITNAINNLDVASVGETGKFIITIKQENGKIEAATKDFVPTLSDGELNAPTTDAVYDALALKQNKLSFTPENAANKVTSVSSTSTDTQYPSAKAVYTALSGKQNSLGYTAENAANKVTSVSSTSTDTQYPSAKAVYTAVSGKLSTTGTAAKATADASGNVITTTYATKTELTTGLSGKLGTSLGSTAASKAVITDASGNITTGTISSGMITDGTIVDSDISTSAAIAQSKISGLANSLAGKQKVVANGEEGKFYVADNRSVWKDMYEAMPKDEACDREGVKCALTHKAGKYSWEVVRER